MNPLALPVAVLLAAASAAPVTIAGEAVQGGLLRGAAPGAAAVLLEGTPLPLAPGGRFLIGFDRDAAAAQRLEIRFADGRVETRILTVRSRAWPIEHVDVARRPGGAASDDYLRMRQGELARIAAARASAADSGGWTQSLLRPARGRVSGRFGAQRVYRGEPAAYHSGVDIAAGAGAAVLAPADGVVTLAPPPMFSLEGNLVIIDHGMGLHSAFLHLARADVRTGDVVRRGQPIGTVGATGRATGPHLHWSLTWNGARLDPEPLMGEYGP